MHGHPEIKSILQATENPSSARKAIHQPVAANRFQSIARGNTERGENASGCQPIYKKRADENSGPDAVTEYEQRGECDPGRWPDRRSARVEKRQLQRQFAGNEIDQR